MSDAPHGRWVVGLSIDEGPDSKDEVDRLRVIGAIMRSHPKGDYVQHDDYAALASELADWKRMRNEAAAQSTFNRNRIEQLETALKGLLGLVQLLSHNEDIPAEIRARMAENHRFKEAQRCFPGTKWDEYGLTAPVDV